MAPKNTRSPYREKMPEAPAAQKNPDKLDRWRFDMNPSRSPPTIDETLAQAALPSTTTAHHSDTIHPTHAMSPPPSKPAKNRGYALKHTLGRAEPQRPLTPPIKHMPEGPLCRSRFLQYFFS
ncbi:hypothetical protein HYALB_00004449 [Hymenoscyphus albidus]|uniref:Uncharacterized protein n=1 Tax=Hymenoscyphus albidus TaxID=595503 RepID=A0A9N9Q0M7_9HELO|nr:hypothetical protein HYALB_00004449 [Hymenoscyphus albidus]